MPILMTSFTDNPFAALTILVAPAILTNASAILCLATSNRLARVVDRTRVVSAELARLTPNADNRPTYEHQLRILRVRSNLILRTLRFFNISVGSFAAATLISLFGSVLTAFVPHVGFTVIAVLALLLGTVGVAGLVAGCATVSKETRLAVESLSDEAQLTPHSIH